MTRRSGIWLSCALGASCAILVGAAVIYWGFYMREHRRWNETLQLWNGRTLDVQQHMSRKAYHGNPHHLNPLWWGGGDRQYEMQFTVNGKQFRWESHHTPIAVQPDEDGTVYIVAFDRESEESLRRLHRIFRLYRSRADGSWDEVSTERFPRHLAIQNRTCGKYSDGSDDDPSNSLPVIQRMAPAENEFQISLNGYLWVFLEDPSDKNEFPKTSFFREFKAKWIRPIAEDKRRERLE